MTQKFAGCAVAEVFRVLDHTSREVWNWKWQSRRCLKVVALHQGGSSSHKKRLMAMSVCVPLCGGHHAGSRSAEHRCKAWVLEWGILRFLVSPFLLRGLLTCGWVLPEMNDKWFF